MGRSHTERRVFVVAMTVALAAFIPCTLVAQVGAEHTGSADSSAAERTAVSLVQTMSQPITLCIVPGSGTMYQGADVPSGAGTRMVWNPRKAAFRAGAIDADGWDDAQVGFWSTAFGNNNQAVGNDSPAGGWNSSAGGSESLAMGINPDAAGRRSVAFSGSASGNHAFAVGLGTTADGEEARR